MKAPLSVIKAMAYVSICAFAVSGPGAFAHGAEESFSYVGKVPASVQGARWGKDPFVPLVVQEEVSKDKGVKAGAPLKLTAVFFSDIRPSAIINDRIVYVGGVIDSHKVVDIGRTHVILHGISGRFRLDMTGAPESQ